jgi:hypothetical protein
MAMPERIRAPDIDEEIVVPAGDVMVVKAGSTLFHAGGIADKVCETGGRSGERKEKILAPPYQRETAHRRR